LWPFSRKGGGALPPESVLGQKKLWEQPVIINGLKLRLKIALSDRGLDELSAKLSKLYPESPLRFGNGMLLAKIKDENKTRRLLFVQPDPRFPALQFSIILNERIPENFRWPAQLPLPSGGKPVNYIHFPENGALYGAFTCVQSPAGAMDDITGILKAAGWRLVSQPLRKHNSATGGIFIKNTPPSLIVASFSFPDSTGISKGSVYMRPFRGK
jgi:hypothetical protein